MPGEEALRGNPWQIIIICSDNSYPGDCYGSALSAPALGE